MSASGPVWPRPRWRDSGAEALLLWFVFGDFDAEFRIDEAKLFVEAPIWGDVYFYSELNLATREESNVALHLGELYLDFENVSQLWNCDRMLNLRIGRLDIPFGEEYLTRDAIDNPLISHSLVDFWGWTK
jgi:hypothetical protein